MTNQQRTTHAPEAENGILKKRILKLESELAALKLINSLPPSSNNLYNNLLDNIPLAILSLDANGYMQLANMSFIKLFDFDKRKLSAKIHINNFMPFQGTVLIKKINKLLNNQMQFDHEIKIKDIGNEDSQFRSRGITILSLDDEVISYMIIIGDITKRKLAENSLIQAKEKAEEANMLKTAFLSNLSHEIRTPLNHIIGFLELILVDETTDEERDEYSLIVQSSSDLLLKRFDDIIDMSKIESGQMDINKERVNVIDFLVDLHEECMNLKQKYRRDNVDLFLNKLHDYTDVVIMTDPIKLRQIIFSFVENAFIFTDKGKVEIGFSIKDKNGICFYVKDTGVGIEAQHHESIFEHFRQVDNSSTRKVGGTGLGLAISRGLAHLLNGKISMQSKPGIGSAFYLSLPESIISLETNSTNCLSSDSAYDWKNTTILIAEYEEIDFNLLKVLLSKTNAKLLRAKTGDEAVRLYLEEKPDLILINFDLPVINGIEFAKIIRSKNSMIPIIAQLDFANDDDNIKAKEAGIDKLITKPIQKASILSTINDFIINSWF
ncbi:MAG: response regulator [Bacteroidetes bacterium]|nr:response regulator [Bacteroidota bacterium]MBL6943370.1 response regulator [Bacteroidales bacterium]